MFDTPIAPLGAPQVMCPLLSPISFLSMLVALRRGKDDLDFVVVAKLFIFGADEFRAIVRNDGITCRIDQRSTVRKGLVTGLRSFAEA